MDMRQGQAEAAGTKVKDGEDYGECRGLKMSRHFADDAPVLETNALICSDSFYAICVWLTRKKQTYQTNARKRQRRWET
jgi:hypothetical protein